MHLPDYHIYDMIWLQVKKPVLICQPLLKTSPTRGLKVASLCLLARRTAPQLRYFSGKQSFHLH
jgi:hypothetical protein